MCVIAVSPVGVNAPTEQNLKDMFQHNDDGAGWAYVLDNRVIVNKGMLTWLDFQKSLALLEKKLKTANKTMKDIAIMFHFRIGTHGPNSEALTHPFPISSQAKHLMALDYEADIAMAHNGIISSVTPRTGWSDTQQYISDILMPLAKTDKAFYKNKYYQTLMRNTISGSRLAFLDNNSEFTLIGDWVETDVPELKGIKYSNLNHEYTYSPSYFYGGYDWGRTYNTKVGVQNIFASSIDVGNLIMHKSQLPLFAKGEDIEYHEVSYDNYGMYVVSTKGDVYTINYQGEAELLEDFIAVSWDEEASNFMQVFIRYNEGELFPLDASCKVCM